MATLENPWIGVDEEKAAAWAALTPEDQRWLGNSNPLDQTQLLNAPNRGQTVDNPAQAATINAAARDAGPGVKSVADIVSLATTALDNVPDQNPPEPNTVVSGTTTPGVFNGTIPNDPNSTEPIFVEILPPASVGDGGTQPADNQATSSGQGGAASPQGTMDYLFQQNQKTVEQSFIYKATKVVSKFSKGMFTQELSGAIVTFEEALAQAALARQAGVAALNDETAQDIQAGNNNTDQLRTDPDANDPRIGNFDSGARGLPAGRPTEYSAFGNYLGAGTGPIPNEYYQGTQARSPGGNSAGPDDGFRGSSRVGTAENSPVTSNNQNIDTSPYANYLGAATGAVPAEYLGNQNIAREE